MVVIGKLYVHLFYMFVEVIFYFLSLKFFYKGLIVLIGVLQVICVVDDEMAPRMKPNAAGEPSVFTFRYGKFI